MGALVLIRQDEIESLNLDFEMIKKEIEDERNEKVDAFTRILDRDTMDPTKDVLKSTRAREKRLGFRPYSVGMFDFEDVVVNEVRLIKFDFFYPQIQGNAVFVDMDLKEKKNKTHGVLYLTKEIIMILKEEEIHHLFYSIEEDAFYFERK